MTNESGYGGFLQFPLCLIASKGRPFHVLMNEAFALGVVNFIDKSRNKPGLDFLDSDGLEQEAALKAARSVIKFSGGGVSSIAENARRAETKISQWTAKFGPTAQVRIRTDLLLGALHEDGDFTEREFRVLLGLYSAIGAKDFAKVTWHAVRDRASGWIRSSSLLAGPDRGPAYSRGQIDRALAELIARKCVSSATYNRGERFWSNSLSPDELWARVCQRKLWRRDVLAEQRERDALQSGALVRSLAAADVEASPESARAASVP